MNGLPKNSTQKELFNLDGKKPKVEKNVHPIDGWVEETLENFLSKY